jgi:hypothetical protein
MEYSKLTKQELINLLENSVAKEKFRNVEENLKMRDKAFSEVSRELDVLKEHIRRIETESKDNKVLSESQANQKLTLLEAQANQKLAVLEAQSQELKSQLEYTANILNKEYKLATLLLNKKKDDNALVEEIIDLYHEALFENKNT